MDRNTPHPYHGRPSSSRPLVETFLPLARDIVQGLRASKIREVANAGMDRDDVLAFWFEPDEVTPDFIRRRESLLNAGETFYTHNSGCPSCAMRCRRVSAPSMARASGSPSPIPECRR
jgi:hypothetical protein